ncbi:MAG: hypothetical protein K2K91_00980 [Ruminococcus sp.]|nr:hypothetical protein [Ruminococcus sp.]
MKKAYVICRDTQTKGYIQFILTFEQKEYYLFTTKYRHSTYNHFKNGILLDKALNFSKIYYDSAIENVTERIYKLIPFIEKEYSISVRRKSRRIKIITQNTYRAELAS